LGTGSDQVTSKPLTQQSFEGEFLNLALQLLRALFGLPFEVLNLPLHRGDLFFFFPDPQTESRLGLLLGLVANRGQPGLHAVLNGQVEFAPGVFEVPLLADQVSLRLLGFGQLGVPLPEYCVKFGNFLCPRIQIGLDKALGLQGLSNCDLAAFLVEPCGDFGFDSLPGRGQLLLLVTDGRFACRDLCLFLSKLGLVPFPAIGDQRRRQRLGQLDLGPATWAGQGWFGH
jgi:hypothetical protein